MGLFRKRCKHVPFWTKLITLLDRVTGWYGSVNTELGPCWDFRALYFYLSLEFGLEGRPHAFMSSSVLGLPGAFRQASAIVRATSEGGRVG